MGTLGKLAIAAAAASIVLLLSGCGAGGELASVKSELATVKSQLAIAQGERDSAREALEPQNNLTSREARLERDLASLESRESKVDDREAALEKAQAELDEREAALDKRSARLAKLKRSLEGESWISDVRECLDRDGDYKSASVTWTSFSGTDFSCYSG